MKQFALHELRDAACRCGHEGDVELNAKDVEYLLALMKRDMRYLRGRGRDTKKLQKASELANKLLALTGKERSDAGQE